MAGGTFKLSQPKVRPGTYVNVINGKQPSAAGVPGGIAMIPLMGYDYGPREQWIHLTASSPDAGKAMFGRSIYDDNDIMLQLQLLFANANEVYVWICDNGAVKAKAEATVGGSAKSTITAKHPGSLGNKIQLVSVANPVDGFDVSVLLNGSEVENFEGAKTVGDLAGSTYVDITKADASKALAAFASLSLTGGTDGSTGENASVAKFLDAAEKVKFNVMAFPSTETSLQTALLTKIKYIRNGIGWKCKAVAPNFKADHEGIYNLTNSFRYGEKDLTVAQACAWLAGAAAAADYVTSLTYKQVVGATAVVGEKNNEASEKAIKAGEIFFNVDDAGNVIIEYDVTSKTTFTQDDPVDLKKGRPSRVYDTLANELLLTFVPNRFDNNSDGWSVMEGLGRAILMAYQNDGAITNVDLEADFQVDQSMSSGDSVYINVGVQAVDSAEKYYFTVTAR